MRAYSVTSSFSLCDTLISRLQLAFPIFPSPLRESSQLASAGNASYGSDFNETPKFRSTLVYLFF